MAMIKNQKYNEYQTPKKIIQTIVDNRNKNF